MNFFNGANCRVVDLETTNEFTGFSGKGQPYCGSSGSRTRSKVVDNMIVEINKVKEPRDIIKLNQILGDRYRVVREIGRGGMGVVYFAQDEKLNRPVAIKMIGSKADVTLEKLERFSFEARVTAHLQHPHIVQVYEAIDTKEFPLYVMEYVEGMRLDNYTNGKDARESISLMVPICKAVGYAHRKGILHRDLKPSNILITSSGEPKIMDFGLAKSLNERAFPQQNFEETTAGIIIGSPSFMSPEQARGDWEKIDTRTDIYSLGTSIYAMLTGKPPFMGKSPIDVIDKVINEEPVAPSKLRSSIPKDIDSICLKAMEKDPDKRYQTTYEMLDDIRNYLNGRPVKAKHYSFKEKTLRSLKLHKEVFILATVLVWLAFTGIAFTLKNHHSTSYNVITNELKDNIKGLAAITGFVINGDVVDSVRSQSDLNRPEVKKVVRFLKGVKEKNEGVQYVWIIRRSQSKPGYAEYVLEHNYYDTIDELDINYNGLLEPEEELSEIGEIYEETHKLHKLLKGLEQPTADRNLSIIDKRDISLSGYAPIVNSKGESVAVVGIDIRSDVVGESFNKIRQNLILSLIFLFLFSILLNALIFFWLIGRWEITTR